LVLFSFGLVFKAYKIFYKLNPKAFKKYQKILSKFI